MALDQSVLWYMTGLEGINMIGCSEQLAARLTGHKRNNKEQQGIKMDGTAL